ncbi:head GIN domain-containing protein [Croceiramulus getboli]|nr:DUF2807 domain-containing protein [Flavobacteriaceae bacterium YJPT1-3]
MKIVKLIIVLSLCWSCDTDQGLTCLQTAGDLVQKEIDLPEFDRILVGQRAQLIIRSGAAQEIVLETGENLLSDVLVAVKDGVLLIENNNSCNLFRDYGLTKIFVTVPALREIRSSTGLPVLSEGVLDFDELRLISTDGPEEDFYHKDGDFQLELNVDRLEIECNGLSNFFLRGSANSLDIQLLEGDSRIEAEDFLVNDVTLFHRGTNDVFLDPQQSIRGELRSTGNLILKNVPPIFEVEAFFTGEIIIED